MPFYEFDCPEHGRFTMLFAQFADMPEKYPCPSMLPDKGGLPEPGTPCGWPSKRVLALPGAIIVEGGTGAGSGRR